MYIIQIVKEVNYSIPIRKEVIRISRKPEYYARYPGFKNDCESMCEVIEDKVFRNHNIVVTIHEIAPVSEIGKSTRGMAKASAGMIDIYLNNIWEPRVDTYNRMKFLFVLFHEYSHLLTVDWAKPMYKTHKHFIELDMDRRAIDMLKNMESYGIKLDHPPFFIPPCVSKRFILECTGITLAGWTYHLTMHTNNPVMKYPIDTKILQHFEADWRMASRMLSDIKGFDNVNPRFKPEVKGEEANTGTSGDGKGNGISCQQSPARPAPFNPRSSGVHKK